MKHQQQAKKALNVLIERSEKAHLAIKHDDFDAFDHWMNLRNHAFHNFRALDHLALKEEPSDAYETEIRDLLKKEEIFNIELKKQVSQKAKKFEYIITKQNRLLNRSMNFVTHSASHFVRFLKGT